MAAEVSKVPKLEDVLSWVVAIAFGAATSAAIVYLLYFSTMRKLVASNDPASWGQFGDYFGGILNPTIALLALLLLAKGVQLQRNTLEATREEMTRMAAIAKRQQFESQFAALMSLLAQHKREHTGQLRTAANKVRAQYDAREDTNVREEFDNIAYALHPLLSLVRTLVHAIKSHDLSEQERVGYLDIVKSHLSTDDGILILLGPYVEKLPESDKELVRVDGLLEYMDPRVRAAVQGSMSNRLQNPLTGK